MILLTSFSNEKEIFREIILDHAKNPRNNKEGSDEYLSAYIKNPACGDEVKLYLKIEENRVADICHISNGCSICIASTSIISEHLKNNSFEENDKIISNYLKMLEGNDYNEELLGELISLKGIINLPARRRCATLGVLAYKKIIHEGDNND